MFSAQIVYEMKVWRLAGPLQDLNVVVVVVALYCH